MSNVNFSLNKVKEETLKNIERILVEGGLIMVSKAKNTLINNKHYVTGRLSKSITTNVEGLTLEFGSNVDYANTIETGISSDNPSVNDIREWAKRKVELGHADKGLIGASKAIANKISATGSIKNFTPFMQPAFSETLIIINEKLKNAIVQENN